jgi:hypothetical protein
VSAHRLLCEASLAAGPSRPQRSRCSHPKLPMYGRSNRWSARRYRKGTG